jgi:outer membrane lipoprotein-sorting protein
MRLKTTAIVAAFIALAFLPGRILLAAASQDDKEKVLHQLDLAAANFHSTSADFEFDNVETEPIPDTDVKKGTVYYQRNGTAFQMAAHIKEHNRKPAPEVYSYVKGTLKLYEAGIDQVTTFSKAGKFESYMMLGFGASGKDLAEKWEIKYLGSETLMDGKTAVKTEKLELIPKDPEVRKNLPKVTVWLDPERAVSLKQVFDLGVGSYRVCVYFNVKTNAPLSADDFTFKTGKQTVFVNK